MAGSESRSVSLCIPTYNDSTVVADALRSAREQDYPGLEILVLDNHSTDDTWRIVTDIAASDSRIRCIRHSENIGMARNFSACISFAQGDYVQILCADDALAPGCVTALATALNKYSGSVLAACGRVFTDALLHALEIRCARQKLQFVPGERLLRECFADGNVIGEPSAVMFRRAAAARGFSADYSQAVDLEMWFHLLESGAAVLLPDPLALIRQHGAQTTQANIRSGRIVQDKRLLFRQYGANLAAKLSVREKLSWDARMASSVARTGYAGGISDPGAITEVFFRTVFRRFLVPGLQVAWKFRGVRAAQRL
jgi:glycosyltransferase involved in cell wall biosynthesis